MPSPLHDRPDGDIAMPMPQRIQYPDAIEPLVQFIEETPPGEILERKRIAAEKNRDVAFAGPLPLPRAL